MNPYMTRILLLVLVSVQFSALANANAKEATTLDARPNILFAFADDWGRHAGAYGTDWLDTPNFDRVAQQGILFTEAYTATAKCAPSRASVLTGRYPWQNRALGNHLAIWPEDDFQTYIEVLTKNGYHTGYTGKGWSPGQPPGDREITGALYGHGYVQAFKDFVTDSPAGKPFHFWFGSRDPHRGYKKQQHSDERLARIDLPSYWKDTRARRQDVADYAFEVERFDSDLGQMLEFLEANGQLANTIVIVSSDNGMPFPRSKGDTYMPGSHLPFAAMWGNQIKNPGRISDQFISFVDIAPTILELANVRVEDTQMEPIQGRSFVDILNDEPSSKIDRSFLLYGRERYDVKVRPDDMGYPSRSIRKGDYLYTHNFAPERLPTSRRESDIPAAFATGSQALEVFYAKRPADELYNIQDDVECVHNLALNPEYAEKVNALRTQLHAELLQHNDPRLVGGGEAFDRYPSIDSPKVRAWRNAWDEKHQRN